MTTPGHEDPVLILEGKETFRMKGKVAFTIVVLVFTVLAGAASASAQGISDFKVPFAFLVEGKEMPAGSYVIQERGEGPLALRTANGVETFVPVITRLAWRGKELQEPQLVFDKVGNAYYLSEVWMPEYDGFLVRATKEAHQHNVVKGQKSKKG